MNEQQRFFDPELSSKVSLPEGMASAEEIRQKQLFTRYLRDLRVYTYLGVVIGFGSALAFGTMAIAFTNMVINEQERFQNISGITEAFDLASILMIYGSAYFVRKLLKDYSFQRDFFKEKYGISINN